MRTIAKGAAPLSYVTWLSGASEEWEPAFDGLQSPEKVDVKQRLLEEQFYLCCYCCGRIDLDGSHIEHLAPQSQGTGELDFENMLASCPGEEHDSPTVGLHCGHKKGDQTLSVTPLTGACQSEFTYNAIGGIAGKSSGAADAIDTLGLDVDKLHALREATLRVYLEDGFTMTPEEATSELARLSQPTDGKLESYLPALEFIIRSYYVPG